ncbi:MAG: GNAT family N-acetyltransferase [Burkholderiaceae bacterium]
MGSSSAGHAAIEVKHNAEARRFEAVVDRLLCRCDYRMHGNTMMLVHTEVPPQLEGHGFASMLVQAAFDYAKENGMDVLPVCSFVGAWARRHPDVEPLLAR